MDVIVSVCEQRLWQLPQEGFQQGGSIIGVEAARFQVDVCPGIEHLPEGGLPQAVAWHTEQPLHMEVCEGRGAAEEKHRRVCVSRQTERRRQILNGGCNRSKVLRDKLLTNLFPSRVYF